MRYKYKEVGKLSDKTPYIEEIKFNIHLWLKKNFTQKEIEGNSLDLIKGFQKTTS